MNSDRIICPKCESDITDYYTESNTNWAGNYICPACGSELEVECNVTVEYVTKLIDKE